MKGRTIRRVAIAPSAGRSLRGSFLAFSRMNPLHREGFDLLCDVRACVARFSVLFGLVSGVDPDAGLLEQQDEWTLTWGTRRFLEKDGGEETVGVWAIGTTPTSPSFP